MGLLDAFQGLGDLSPDQSQGLLAAAAQILQQSGPSRMPTSFGQILGGGLGAYQQGVSNSQKQRQEQEQAALAKKLMGFKLKDAESDFNTQELARADALKAQQTLGGLYSQQSPTDAAASVLGSNMAPTAANAAMLAAAPQSNNDTTDDYGRLRKEASALRGAGLFKAADAKDLEALKYKPEYSQSPQIGNGPDGKPALYVLDKNGTPKFLSGVSPQAKIRELNLGGTTQLIDDNAAVPGQVFKHSQSPDSIAVDRRAAADLAAGGASPSLNDSTLDFMADQALRGDTAVYQNLGRGAQGAANLVALRTRVAQKAKDQGLGGGDLASIGADYQGQKAGLRTSGTISARIENAAAEAAQLAPLAVEAGRNVARSGFLPFGKAQIMFDTNTNNPALNKFATANIGLATAYASAMARGNKPTVSDNEHARELLQTAKSQEAYEAIVSQMEQEIKAAQAAPQVVRNHLRQQIRGGDNAAASAPNPFTPTPAAPQRKSVLPNQVIDGYRYKGGDPSLQTSWEKQ